MIRKKNKVRAELYISAEKRPRGFSTSLKEQREEIESAPSLSDHLEKDPGRRILGRPKASKSDDLTSPTLTLAARPVVGPV